MLLAGCAMGSCRPCVRYAMEKFLKKFEVIHPLEPVLAVVRGHNVYPRANLHTLHTAENWMREPMRRVRDNEMPFKRVKVHISRHPKVNGWLHLLNVVVAVVVSFKTR